MIFLVFFTSLWQLGFVFSSFLDSEANYRVNKVERNNIVNKGVWVRNYKENDKTGNFLFRGNSIDVDNIVQSDFQNTFGAESMPISPFISSYIERNKREIESLKRSRKDTKDCTSKNCNENDLKDNHSMIKSKLITKLRPASVFNDYPYEIAVLLNNDKSALEKPKNNSNSTYVLNELKKENRTVAPLNDSNSITDKIEEIINGRFNKTNYTIVPKRSMNNYEAEIIKNIELIDDVSNKTEDLPKPVTNRDVFAKDEKVWRQSAPIPDSNKYRVIGKDESNKVVRPVTERGLIKVLSMLTNTFKKIMKQHNDIKEIHRKLHSMNENFLKNVEMISDKFQDFETKYTNMVNVNQRINEIEEKLTAKEEHFKTKERELSKNLIEFEIQQKKFLTQQRQFFNIQKLMLAQNEKINSKQNAIAKTQSEISHRQNNFARILKKAKQVYIENKNGMTKTSAYAKLESQNESKVEYQIESKFTTAKADTTTEFVKINLFSVPIAPKIENQDLLLLKAKDEQPVDDLVYKYYFNNTFIDSLMKNFLSGFINNGESNDSTRNIKNKRGETKESNTLLLPVKGTKDFKMEGKIRERRWINHHSKRKWRRKFRGKGTSEKVFADDEKPVKNQNQADTNFDSQQAKPIPLGPKKLDLQKSDPFIVMATGFCNGIGQNTSPQVLNWCVEKALRRLQNIVKCMKTSPKKKKKVDYEEYDQMELADYGMDIKIPPPSPVPEPIKEENLPKRLIMQEVIANTYVPTSLHTTIETSEFSNTAGTQPEVTVLSTTYPPMTTIAKETTLNIDSFFPDNEKLESNLKQFDIKPDTEGNVYYDGSLHASDIIKDNKNTGESDVMPGLESNSRIDNMDPYTFDPQAMRKAFLKRSFLSRMKYESMLSKVKKL